MYAYSKTSVSKNNQTLDFEKYPSERITKGSRFKDFLLEKSVLNAKWRLLASRAGIPITLKIRLL